MFLYANVRPIQFSIATKCRGLQLKLVWWIAFTNKIVCKEIGVFMWMKVNVVGSADYVV